MHYGSVAESTISHVNPGCTSRFTNVNPGDLIMAITGENVEDIGKTVAWMGNETIYTGGHSLLLRHKQDPKYLSYCMTTSDFNRQKARYAHGVKVVELSPEQIAKIEIPLPSLEVQRRISAAIENFDRLISDITSGLPAEIEARRKQYAYYRDKLLTFKEKVS